MTAPSAPPSSSLPIEAPPSLEAPGAPAPPPRPSLSLSLSSRAHSRRGGGALAVAGTLAAAVALFYARLLSPDSILLQRDAFRLHVPIREYLRERVLSGEFPLWYPFDGLGRPFVDTAVSAVFHPFTALFLALPALTAYKLAVLVCCLVAAAGSAWLARRLGASGIACVLAGIGLAFSGYVASLSDNLLYLYPVCCFPAFLAALDAGLQPGARRGPLAAAALIWASVFLDGDPQAGLLYGLAGLAWALLAPGSGGGRRPQRAGAFALVGAFAALLSAAQLLPMWTAFRGSARGGEGLDLQAAFKWSTPPARLVELLAGTDHGPFAVPIDPAFAGGSVWARSLYLGLPLLAMAALATWRRRGGARLLAGIGGVALLLSLGAQGGLAALAARLLPLWSAFRYPEKLQGLFACTVAVLAALGFDELLRGRSRPRFWSVVAGLAAAGAAAYAVARAGRFGAVLADPAVRGLAFAAAVALGVAAVAAAARRRPGSLALSVLMVALVGADLARVNLSAYRTGPVDVAEFRPPLLEAIEKAEAEDARAASAAEPSAAPGAFRVISYRLSRYAVPRALGEALGEDAEVVAVRNALDQEHNALFGLETPSAYLPGESAALKAILMDQPTPEVLARFNVKYIIGASSQFRAAGLAPHVLASLPGFDLAVARNPVAPWPRAYLARRVARIEPGDSNWRAALADGAFRRGEVDYVEGVPSAPSTQPLNTQSQDESAAPPGLARITSYGPERVAVHVETPTAATLILSDAFDGAWRAELDGAAPLTVRRANFLVRAVEVPAGSHEIVFRYSAGRVLAGAALSALGVLLLAGYLLLGRRRGGLVAGDLLAPGTE